MKKFFSFFVLLWIAASVPAMDFFPPIGGFFGLGLETNGHTREGVAFGGGLTLGMDLNESFSAGIKNSYFHNFDNVSALELNLFFRYYLPWLHVPKETDGPFVQAELGAVILFETGYYKYAEAAPAFSGGISAGWRFNLGEHWYIDPAIRVGYPHIWGVSVTAGFKIRRSGEKVVEYQDREVTVIEYIEREVIEYRDREVPVIEYRDREIIIPAAPPEPKDTTPPSVMISHTPELFNPEKEDITFTMAAWDESPIADWKLEVYQPESRAVFYSTGGEGNPPAQLIWDGIGNNGDLVHTASNYPYAFTVTDMHGNKGQEEKTIKVDVYITNDDDGNMRIQIPSIIFRADHADFVGLGREITENNRRIFESVASLLNTYKDYAVIVEGHSNPTTAPGTTARVNEERSLQVLSENRAKRVVEELVQHGVDRNRLTAVGVGVTKLIVPWDDRENNWKNRRVEFILMESE